MGNNTTVGQLKELYKKLGGTDADAAGIKTIAQAIDKIEDVAGSGGSGGGGLLIVNCETLEASPWCQLDTTAGDIIDAIEAGKAVMISDQNGNLEGNISGMTGAKAYLAVTELYVKESGDGVLSYSNATGIYNLMFDNLDDYPHPYSD